MPAVCIGNSHMGAVIEAAIAASHNGAVQPHNLAFVLLHKENFQPTTIGCSRGARLNPTLQKAIVDACDDVGDNDSFSRIAFFGAKKCRSAIFSLIGGNAHNIMGLMRHEEPFDFVLSEKPELPLIEGSRTISESEIYDIMRLSISNELENVLRALSGELHVPMFHIESPPPIRNTEHILANLDPFFHSHEHRNISPAHLRYKLWRIHSRVMSDLCGQYGLTFVPVPNVAFDQDGFLLEELTPDNATHANAKYGSLIIAQIQALMEEAQRRTGSNYPNPYVSQGSSAFWKEAVAQVAPEQIAPVSEYPFRIKASDRVATAGSCFAQHIARHLQSSGFNYYVAERAHPLLTPDLAKRYNYGVFSARYGNIYSSRQLLQLFQRAENEFVPQDRFWRSSDGFGFVDPYRPVIQPVPFPTIKALEEDRAQHLQSISAMMRSLDVFVFTLGLTECWVNKADGAAYPLCPGTSGGSFDPEQHIFLNLKVGEVRDDLIAAFNILHSVNPAARVILTVSPVPLKATATHDHVLSATTYSKSVLRSAAGEISQLDDRIIYFPSYEIITGSYARGRYFADNLRDIEPAGVDHVMRVFQACLTETEAGSLEESPAADNLTPVCAASSSGQGVAELVCEEEMLEMERLLAVEGTR